MTQLVLIRHGQTDWNAKGRWQGQADPSLNEQGREEARRTARELRQLEFATLYSSDLRRALETAHIIALRVGVQVIPEPRLREINLGVWQGMLATDIQREYPHEFQQWHTVPLDVRPPGGEDLVSLAVRVLEATNEIIRQHPQQTVAIVAHEFPIAIMRCRAAGLELGRIREMVSSTGTWQQIVWNGVLT